MIPIQTPKMLRYRFKKAIDKLKIKLIPSK